MNSATGDGGQSLTVHQWLRQLAPDYSKRFGSSMPERQRQVLKKILSCRTPALGGQMFQCPDCPGFDYRYHSCNDRHCPQCGQTDADDWLARQRARLLLPTPYFLATFTVPEELRYFIRSHQQIALDLLFASSAQALQELAGNPRRLGAQLGMLGVLHTWSRTLIFHPHLHYLIPGGGLSPDGRRWVPARNKFLLPVKVLGAHFRTVFKTRLQKEHPELFAQVPAKVWKRHWNVDCRPAGSGENALRYLARYVFKTATANRPVQLLTEGKVRWNYRESKTGKLTSIKLEPLDFMGRFLQHILPRSFARVRTPRGGAGCIRPPKCAPIACGPCCGKSRCSRPPSRKRGTRHPTRTWNHRPSLNPQPSTLNRTGARSVRCVNGPCGWWARGTPAGSCSIPNDRHESASAASLHFRPRRVRSSAGGLCPEVGFSRE